MDLFKRLNKGHFAFLANVSWLIGDRVVRLPLSLVVSVLVARYLQPEQFGVYSIALAMYAIFSAFVNLGLQSVMVRWMIGATSKVEDLLYVGFLAQLAAAFISIICIGISAVFIAGFGTTNFWVIAIASFGLIPKTSDVCRYFFESKAQFKYPVIADNVSYIASALMRLLLIYLEAPLLAFAWLFVLEICIAGVLLYSFQRRYREAAIQANFQKSVAFDLLAKSWPLLISNLATAVYMRVDQLLLNYFKGSESVGLFVAAMRLVEAWNVFPAVVVLALNPILIRSLLHSTDMHQRRYRLMLVSLVAGTALISLVVCLASHLIEQLLYGATFPGSGLILSITIWSSVFVIIQIASNQWLVNHHLNSYVGIRTVIGVMVTIVANLILIPRYGAVGTAISLLIAQAAAALSILVLPKARASFGL